MSKNFAPNWDDLAKRALTLEELTGINLTVEQDEGRLWVVSLTDHQPKEVGSVLARGRVGEVYDAVSIVLRWERIKREVEGG